jgi:hypothetical protein
MAAVQFQGPDRQGVSVVATQYQWSQPNTPCMFVIDKRCLQLLECPEK